jgi:hypothetical protein
MQVSRSGRKCKAAGVKVKARPTNNFSIGEIMSDINKGTDIFGWRIYNLSSSFRKQEILREIDLDKNLPLCTWQGQIGLLDGAPEEILLAYLPKVYWKAQIVLFNNLPAQALPRAEKLLDDRAKSKLGLVKKTKKDKKAGWSYGSSML